MKTILQVLIENQWHIEIRAIVKQLHVIRIEEIILRRKLRE